MKKLYITVFAAISLTAHAQVGIGKEQLTNESVILEFFDEATNQSGILLPIVSDLPAPSAGLNGTILMDRDDAVVKWCSGGYWINLTGSYPTIADPDILEDGDLTGIAENTSDDSGNGVTIGSADAPIGVLELKASDKAMVLPKVPDPHLNVKSPMAGMMVYDTVSRSLALFDGRKWSYWN